MNKSRFVKNVLFGFGGHLIVMILGIIIPRIMITSYGSDVNGLVNTVTQIFTYMALLEAGIGQAARNALYKPIANNNKGEISNVLSIANKYFRNVTIYYAIGVVLLSIIGPLIIKTDVNRKTVFLIILLEGMSGVISFYYIQTITTLLSADGRNYVNNGINVANKVISYAVKIIMAANGINIVILQLAYFVITVFKVVFYRWYFKKKYGWVVLGSDNKRAKLPDRNAYIITEIAWTIFSSTDMIVLSTFVNTKASSVYAVYNLVFASLNTLLNTVYISVNYVLGQLYHSSKRKYMEVHDAFTSLFFGGMTVLMCTAYVLIIPFIRLYTKGITDTQYIDEKLPIMFCLIQVISWSRYITGNLSGVSGYAKQTSRVSLVEALLNVLLSIILVKRFGTVGVLFATVVSLPLKVIYLTWLSEKIILKRRSFRYIAILVINYVYFGAVVAISNHLPIVVHSYWDFAIYGGAILGVCTFIGVILNLLVNPACIKIVKMLRIRGIRQYE